MGRAIAYHRRSLIAAECAAIAISTEDIDQANQAQNTLAANSLLVVVASRGAAAATAAVVAGLDSRRGHAHGGHGKHGDGSKVLHVYRLMAVAIAVV
jgi:hypothetical protein